MIHLNGSPINVTIFPDKTSQVWKLPEFILKNSNWASITWDFENEAEFMHIAQLADLLWSHNIEYTLNLKYLPYGRQDKVIQNDSTFALKSFANLLNTLSFKEVIITDPHSEIALKLIEGSRAVYPKDDIDKAIKETGSKLVCYPDKGAVTKYTKIYDYSYVYGEKVRDQATGNILSYELIADTYHTDFYGKSILIIDDICDGGMTFKILAKDLLAAGAQEVNLFVTHGIFSRGLETLHESGIKHVYTKDGEVSTDNNKLTYRRL